MNADDVIASASLCAIRGKVLACSLGCGAAVIDDSGLGAGEILMMDSARTYDSVAVVLEMSSRIRWIAERPMVVLGMGPMAPLRVAD